MCKGERRSFLKERLRIAWEMAKKEIKRKIITAIISFISANIIPIVIILIVLIFIGSFMGMANKLENEEKNTIGPPAVIQTNENNDYLFDSNDEEYQKYLKWSQGYSLVSALGDSIWEDIGLKGSALDIIKGLEEKTFLFDHTVRYVQTTWNSGEFDINADVPEGTFSSNVVKAPYFSLTYPNRARWQLFYTAFLLANDMNVENFNTIENLSKLKAFCQPISNGGILTEYKFLDEDFNDLFISTDIDGSIEFDILDSLSYADRETVTTYTKSTYTYNSTTTDEEYNGTPTEEELASGEVFEDAEGKYWQTVDDTPAPDVSETKSITKTINPNFFLDKVKTFNAEYQFSYFSSTTTSTTTSSYLSSDDDGTLETETTTTRENLNWFYSVEKVNQKENNDRFKKSLLDLGIVKEELYMLAMGIFNIDDETKTLTNAIGELLGSTEGEDVEFEEKEEDMIDFNYGNGGSINIKYFNQHGYDYMTVDNKRYSMADIGDGYSCIAMIISSLSKTNLFFTPINLANDFFEKGIYYETTNGAITSDMLENIDVLAEDISCNIYTQGQDIINSLVAGQPIIVGMGKGDFNTKDSVHYIVLTGIDENGKVSVADPFDIYSLSRKYHIKTILNQSVTDFYCYAGDSE